MSVPVTIDFETEAIEFGSGRYPKPVGVSIKLPGEPSRYYAWGHPTENNCTEEEGKAAVAAVWDHVLMHNCKFDIGVAMEHFGLPWPRRWEDTQYLLYLDNPIADTLSLKPSAERILGLPPDEQEAVRDWLLAHGITRSTKNWGAFISKAPGGLVGKYAIGDTDRTFALYEYLLPRIQARDMVGAYERELLLSPVLYYAERDGVRIDRERLLADTEIFECVYADVDNCIRRELASPGLEVDKAAELVRAIEAAGFAHNWPLTPTGRKSTSREAITNSCTNAVLSSLLAYRGALKTILTTFMRPWVELSARDGRLHPNWNNVRGDLYGTRTGRLSCSNPNLQNVPTEFEMAIPSHLLELPFMRRYILPEEGHVIVPSDYNGQEVRILAHFAEGRAAEIYRNDPRADLHEIAAKIISEESGLHLKRKQTKVTAFSVIYGAGPTSMAAQLHCSVDEARRIRRAYFDALPGVEEFIKAVSNRSSVRTWGGRIIPCEPPKIVNGQMWSFEYKLANHLIQGTAADQTKEACIRYDRIREHGKFLLTVHDENVVSVPVDKLHSEVKLIRHAMEDMEGFDVPFKVDVEYGDNWHDLKPYFEPADKVVLQRAVNL